ncbi:hypothetical protein L1987_04768 [Smallanthus sonchifolius]|uniref:Uncharacterized protein n=1 Tax=Smallanthus sonchifolius TaxID=185202 RepID=A0ACB9JTH4_9ASTR|nr:hypothetical protein L1987_04768 [Smallanthus sonchifolius]
MDKLHTNSGEDDSSYANNSIVQKLVIQDATPFLKRTIKGLANQDDFFNHCFVIADLGCSSGMNTLLVVSSIIDTIHELFQVPEGLEDNKLNIHIAKTSPLNVSQAYGNQFRIDFTNFLQLRSEEMVCGGHMVLTIPSRSTVDPTCDDGCDFWELLTISLIDMLKEGLVREADINSFNLPFYFPHEDELRNIIQVDRSFSLDSMNISKLDEHDADYDNKVKNTAKFIRAITEPLLASHFGKSINEDAYE